MAKETKEEFRLRIESEWLDRYPQNNLKVGNKNYQLAHNSFFLGAMIGANINIPFWSVCISTGKNVLETVKELKEPTNNKTT